MKNWLLILLSVMLSCTEYSSEKEAIMHVMHQQETDWNSGNIEAFMQGYWQSDSLMFIGKNGIKYGWQTTLDNYKNSYPDKAAMGTLSFEILQLEQNNHTAYMLGKWNLQRESDNPNGYFTLYWKKIEGHWVIVIDHTS
ncbi:MAG: nuclear transport factor 2 family protein [Flavobacteriales bacterium]|nr:nuclear transport factor 2 family protein [Flavobacteriales bacterium]